MQRLASIAGGALLLACASCASSPAVLDSWRDPGQRVLEPERTVVVVVSGETNFRRATEEELVSRLHASRSGTSYAFLDAAALQTPKEAAELARAHGFDSALVVRVLGVGEPVPELAEGATPGYVHMAGQSFSTAVLWSAGGDEGLERRKRTFRLQARFYTLGSDKLVWSGIVEVHDPQSARELAHQSATVLAEELCRQKLAR
jgi:hypothetical protein